MDRTKYTSIVPSDIPIPRMFNLMLGSIAPRPIAFVSTIDEEGRPNLAPFSFFNGFGANPPVLVFSPSRRGRDNTTKHTYDNVKVWPEVVVNIVNYDMVQQMSLASSDFPKGVSEFEKVGFTPLPSDLVKPMRVAESPVQYECKVMQVIETGTEGSAGNLVICEIVKMHIRQDLILENGTIDQQAIDLVGRMGGNYYVRATGDALFEVEKPLASVGIGVDSLPHHIRYSKILTGNDLGQLGNLKTYPSEEDIAKLKDSQEVAEIFNSTSDPLNLEKMLHNLAHSLISEGKVDLALSVLLLKS